MDGTTDGAGELRIDNMRQNVEISWARTGTRVSGNADPDGRLASPAQVQRNTSSALVKFRPCQSVPGYADDPTQTGATSQRATLRHGAQAQVASEAARILDDFRRAILCQPKGARAAALQFMRAFARQIEAETFGGRGGLAPWQKRKVDRYLSDHLAHRICTEQIADQVALSTGHFCRAFKESYGTSPHTHIIGLRLELAQRLMLTTAYPLSQIAVMCGMADQSHLSKLFRRRVGATPAAWRRRHLPDDEAEARFRDGRAGRPAEAAACTRFDSPAANSGRAAKSASAIPERR